MRRLLALGVFALTCLAIAQSVATRHWFVVDGQPLGRLTGVSGGERYVIVDGVVKENTAYRPLELAYVPVPGEELNAWMKKMMGAPKIGEATIFSPRDPQSGLPTGRRASFQGFQLTDYVIPAMDPASEQGPDSFRVHAQFNPKEVGLDKSVRRRPGRVKYGDITLRLTMDGSVREVEAADACRVTVETGDLDGDGAPDVFLHLPEFSFEVSSYNRDPYVEDVARAAGGSPVERLLTYTVLSDGQELVTVEAVVAVVGIETVNMLPFDGTPGRSRVIVKGWNPKDKKVYIGHVTLVK